MLASRKRRATLSSGGQWLLRVLWVQLVHNQVTTTQRWRGFHRLTTSPNLVKKRSAGLQNSKTKSLESRKEVLWPRQRQREKEGWLESAGQIVSAIVSVVPAVDPSRRVRGMGAGVLCVIDGSVVYLPHPPGILPTDTTTCHTLVDTEPSFLMPLQSFWITFELRRQLAILNCDKRHFKYFI